MVPRKTADLCSLEMVKPGLKSQDLSLSQSLKYFLLYDFSYLKKGISSTSSKIKSNIDRTDPCDTLL